MSKSQDLQVAARPTDAPLTPEQKRFNSLIRQIDKARRTLNDWREQVPAFRQAYDKMMQPLQSAFVACSTQWLHGLDALLSQRTWSRSERRMLTHLLCEDAGMLLGIMEDDTVKALFDKHSQVSFETGKQRELQSMKEMTEMFTGLDLGDEIRTEEDLAERMHEEMAARAAAEQARKQRRAQGRRKTDAQLRREAEAQLATQSMREVYRKLVSALHPDREPDPDLRAHKNDLMQRVNKAYDAKDLLTLLEVQVQAESVQMAKSVGSISGERLQHYNKVLAEQLAGLKTEIDAQYSHFCAEFAVESLAPDPRRLGALLEQRARLVRGDLRRQQSNLRLLSDPVAMRSWLKTRRRQQSHRWDPDESF